MRIRESKPVPAPSPNRPTGEKARPARNTPQKANGAQAIDRALNVLQCFGGPRGEYTLSELSEQLGLSPSTAHRILLALVRRGFLSQNIDTRAYHLGGMMLLLGETAHHRLGMDRAIPILVDIESRFHYSVSLGIREGHSVGVLHRIESRRELRFSQSIGSRVPLHASAMGKAILCGADDLEGEIAALGNLPSLTPLTICDADALAQEIRLSVERGYTCDNEEQVIGVRCLGAPIRDREDRVRAAFAIQAPAAHLDADRMHEIGKTLSTYADRLAEAMHFVRPA